MSDSIRHIFPVACSDLQPVRDRYGRSERSLLRIALIGSGLIFCVVSGAFGAKQPGSHPTIEWFAGSTLPAQGNTTYYVDGRNGDDSNPGVTRHGAWKSVMRVNQTAFSGGDRVLFAGGQTFAGGLKFKRSDSGDESGTVLVSSFGRSRATLDAGAGDGLVIDNCAHIVVKDLNFIGCGRKSGSDGAGISLNRTRHVELSDIHVSGFRIAGVAVSGDEDTRITYVYAHDNGSAGIMTSGGDGDLPRTHNLYIGHCIAENNPGDPKNLTNHSGNGIVVGGLDGALIEYCEASNNGWDMPRKGNGPVGIWGYDCDRLTIQHCISHDNKSPGDDGDGFDFDGGVTNSVLQYNLSYSNVGCGYLLCQYPGAPRWSNNIVRYNISVDDGSKNFQSGIGLWIGAPGMSDALIYNNTIVNPWHAVVTLGDVPGMVYRNNIFFAVGDILTGNFAHSRFENNSYLSTGQGALYRDEATVYATLENWADATGQERVDGRLVGLAADPHLILPTAGANLPTDPVRLVSMRYYRLRADSVCVGAGTVIPDNGGYDLFGHRLTVAARPSLGADEAGNAHKD